MLRPAHLLLLALAWPVLATAAPRWFDLEILVFAREGLPPGNELWPEYPGLPDTTATLPPAAGTAPLRLVDTADRLRRQPRHTVLLHTAWRQPVGSRKRAQWVRLTDAPDGTSMPILDGMVRLSVRRYLHLDLDLVVTRELDIPVTEPVARTVAIPLAEPVATPVTVITPGAAPAPAESFTRVRQPFRLIDSRRMRSDELHYVDHPAFGVLVLATAYQPPVPTEPIQPTAAMAPDAATSERDGAAETPSPTSSASGNGTKVAKPAAASSPATPATPATSTPPAKP